MIFSEAPMPDLSQFSPILQGGSFAILSFIAYWLMYSAYPKWTETQKIIAAEHTNQLTSIINSAIRRENQLVEVIKQQSAETSRQREEHREYMSTEMDKRDAVLREIGDRIQHCPHRIEHVELAVLPPADRRHNADPKYRGPERRSD